MQCLLLLLCCSGEVSINRSIASCCPVIVCFEALWERFRWHLSTPARVTAIALAWAFIIQIIWLGYIPEKFCITFHRRTPLKVSFLIMSLIESAVIRCAVRGSTKWLVFFNYTREGCSTKAISLIEFHRPWDQLPWTILEKHVWLAQLRISGKVLDSQCRAVFHCSFRLRWSAW